MSAGPTPELATGLKPDRQTEGCPQERAAFRQALRRKSVEQRLALPADTCNSLSAAICAHVRRHFPYLGGQHVAFCWPLRNEPDLRPLMLSWLESGTTGFRALLPVVLDTNAPLSFRAWTPDSPMCDDRFGIPTPSTGDFLQPQALLIPVNAFDAAGYRIGYGGGFFDRTLAALNPRPLAIGVGFELSRVDSICPEAHDICLDAVVTEAGVFMTRFAE